MTWPNLQNFSKLTVTFRYNFFNCGHTTFLYGRIFMLATPLKYLSFFIFLTLFSSAGGFIDGEKPSEKEEIKDTIVVHGMTLYGKIVKISPEKLSFRLMYSEGLSHFAYKDIESISTKYTYHISYNRMDIEGRIVGIEDNTHLNVVQKDNKERTVKIASIDNFIMSVNDDDSFENRVRNKFPYTKGNINVGFKLEQGSTVKNSVDVQFNLQRKKAEHEIKLYIDYEYETRETATTPKYDYTDELVGILTYKNHFRSDQFWYTSLAADYDRIRFVKNRYVPSLGYGYRFNFSKSVWLEPTLGLGYATTRYTDEIYPDKNFAAAAVGLSGKYRMDDVTFINTFIIDGFLLYYPSLENPDEDWIFRSNLNFTIPLFDFLSVKLSLNHINDTNPAPNVGNNKTTTNLLFGLDF